MRLSPLGLQPARFSSPRTYATDVSRIFLLLRCIPVQHRITLQDEALRGVLIMWWLSLCCLLTWASRVGHLAQAQLVDASDSIAVMRQRKFHFKRTGYYVIQLSHLWQSKALPVRGFRVSTPKEVPQGTRRRDLCISGVEDHADVFGNNSRLDAMVQLQRGDKGKMFDGFAYREVKH